MQEIEVKSFIHYQEKVLPFLENSRVRPLFRGVTDRKHELVTTIGRICNQQSYDKAAAYSLESRILSNFKRKAIPHLERIPQTVWEWLVVARHHGFPARVLDWTLSPFVALYFALEGSFKTDRAVYVLQNFSHSDIDKSPSPFDIQEVRRISPPHFTKRVTIHPDFMKPYSSDDHVVKIVIPLSIRDRMMELVIKCGFDRFTLFPDLDNLAKHLDWLLSDKYYPYEDPLFRSLKRTP